VSNTVPDVAMARAMQLALYGAVLFLLTDQNLVAISLVN
jgi:hypothetical protein